MKPCEMICCSNTFSFFSLFCLIPMKPCEKIWCSNTFSCRDAQNHRIAVQLDLKGVATIKMALLLEKTPCWAKKLKKIGPLRVILSELKRFKVLMWDCHGAQNHRIAVQLDFRAVATVKTAHLLEKNCVLFQKTSKNWVSWGMPVCTKTLRNFTVWLKWC